MHFSWFIKNEPKWIFIILAVYCLNYWFSWTALSIILIKLVFWVPKQLPQVISIGFFIYLNHGKKMKKIVTTFYVFVDTPCLPGRMPLAMNIYFNIMYIFFRWNVFLCSNVMFSFNGVTSFILFQWDVFFVKCFDIWKGVWRTFDYESLFKYNTFFQWNVFPYFNAMSSFILCKWKVFWWIKKRVVNLSVIRWHAAVTCGDMRHVIWHLAARVSCGWALCFI